jgi:N4-gp56 family major capsid protein
MPDYMNTVSLADGAVSTYGPTAENIVTTHVRDVYSRDIYFKALPIMKFLSFAKMKMELNTQPGMTIKVMTYNNITKGGALTEGTPIPTQAMTAAYKDITVGERGNAVSFTELALRTSFTDLMADATTQLGRDMAIVLDCELRDVACTGGSGTSTIYGRKDSTAAKVAAVGEVGVTNILSVATVKDGVEILAVANCPKINGDFYVCFVHPHVSRNLRDDSAWINASNYGDNTRLYTGEIGRIDDVRFVETSLMPNGAAAATDYSYDATLANAGAGGIDLYKSVMFGEEYFGYAVALPVELRDNGVEDHGRKHSIAWYAIWGSGILNADRGIIIISC